MSVGLLIVLAAAAQPVDGSNEEAFPVPREIGEARALIAGYQFEAARTILGRRLANDPRDVETLFLLGIIGIAEQDYGGAANWFRRAIIIVPSSTRIRLELARALYFQKRYEESLRQFQLARAGNPPPGVIQSIERYLASIRDEKGWSYQFSLSIAPDSNINNGTSARETLIFGLPFNLTEDTRRKSGVGAEVSGSVEFAPRIGPGKRLKLGIAALRREYGGSRFDDTRLIVHAGPRLILGKLDVTLLGTGYVRWFGTRRYSQSYGTRLDVTHYPDTRSALNVGLSADAISYPHQSAQNGANLQLTAAYTRALSPAKLGMARFGIGRQTAKVSDLAYWSGFLGAGLQRDLKGGFSVAVESNVGGSRFDSADPFFGIRRKDWTVEVPVSVLNRKLVLSRFTPRLTYTFTKRWSNIDLYDFAQHRFEAGVTTAF